MTPTLYAPAQILDELADKLEAATGPSRELDSEIGIAVGLSMVDRTGQPGWHGMYFVGYLPDYTASFDASIPGECIVTMGAGAGLTEFTVLHDDESGIRAHATAKTEPLARRAAALRALAARVRRDGRTIPEGLPA